MNLYQRMKHVACSQIQQTKQVPKQVLRLHKQGDIVYTNQIFVSWKNVWRKTPVNK